MYPQIYKKGNCNHKIRTGYLKKIKPSENQEELLEIQYIWKTKDSLEG